MFSKSAILFVLTSLLYAHCKPIENGVVPTLTEEQRIALLNNPNMAEYLQQMLGMLQGQSSTSTVSQATQSSSAQSSSHNSANQVSEIIARQQGGPAGSTTGSQSTSFVQSHAAESSEKKESSSSSHNQIIEQSVGSVGTGSSHRGSLLGAGALSTSNEKYESSSNKEESHSASSQQHSSVLQGTTSTGQNIGSAGISNNYNGGATQGGSLLHVGEYHASNKDESHSASSQQHSSVLKETASTSGQNIGSAGINNNYNGGAIQGGSLLHVGEYHASNKDESYSASSQQQSSVLKETASTSGQNIGSAGISNNYNGGAVQGGSLLHVGEYHESNKDESHSASSQQHSSVLKETASTSGQNLGLIGNTFNGGAIQGGSLLHVGEHYESNKDESHSSSAHQSHHSSVLTQANQNAGAQTSMHTGESAHIHHISEEEARALARNAKYEYSYLVDDNKRGNFQEKYENRANGVVNGAFAYDDGYIQRVVHYHDDGHGMVITRDDITESQKAKTQRDDHVRIETLMNGDKRVLSYLEH